MYLLEFFLTLLFINLNIFSSFVLAQLQAIHPLNTEPDSYACFRRPYACALDCAHGFIRLANNCLCACQLDPCLVCFLFFIYV